MRRPIALYMHGFTTLLLVCWLTGLLLLSSCQRENVAPTCQGNCTTLSGRLTTGRPAVGLANTPVLVLWANLNYIFPISKTIAQTTTDANGNYSVSFYVEDDELKNNFFKLFFKPDTTSYYLLSAAVYSLPQLARGTDYTVAPYYVPGKAYIQLAITNQSQLLTTPGGAFTSDFHFITAAAPRYYYDKTVFWNKLPMPAILPVGADQLIQVSSTKTRNGLTTNSTDSLRISAGTTRTYTVTY